MHISAFEEPHLQSVLDKIARKEGFQQPKFSISSGSKPGDNFACRIFRVVITESDGTKTEKPLSLIFKASPLSKARQEKVSLKDLNRTEADVYKTVLPTLNKLLNKYGVVKSDIFPNTARCYESNLEDELCDILVLEDKATDGFRMLGEHKSFDVEHCRQVLKSLALWHASSFALRRHDPETSERFKRLLSKQTIFNDVNNPLMGELKQSFFDGLGLLQEPIRKGNDTYEKLYRIFENLPNDIVKANEIPLDLSCIIQGDCWFNNILYKYSKDGTLYDVCMLDHQITRFASPALDLANVLLLCTTKEVRDASYEELIRFYHSQVSSHLKMMDCDAEKIFPWELLQEHLKRYGVFGVIGSLMGLHVVLVDSADNSVNLHSVEDDGAVFAGRAKTSDPKKQEAISQRMTDVVTDACRLGII